MSNTIEVLSAVHGIAPRSDQLLRLGTDFEKGRVSHQAFDEQIAVETEQWLQLQQDTGIDLQENGKLNWQDHLRPIVKTASGFADNIDDAAITRWFEDNRFYRKPTIIDRLRLNLDRFEEEFPPTGEHISLLSPGTFADLCTDNYPELPARRNVLQLYSELLFHLQTNGARRITFEEYSNATLGPDGKNSALADIETLAGWCPDLQFAVINPRNNEVAIPWRLKSNLGVQIPAKDIPIIAREPEYHQPDFRKGEIWHTVIDSGTTLEDGLDTALISLETLCRLGVARVVLTHTVDLECLPLPSARDKIKQLGEFANKLGEQL